MYIAKRNGTISLQKNLCMNVHSNNQLCQEKPRVKKRKGKFRKSRLKLKDGNRISLPSGWYPGDLGEGFPGEASVKNPPANAGDVRPVGSIPGSGRSLGGGHGNPLQYSCLENSMDRGAWRAAVHEPQRVGHN